MIINLFSKIFISDFIHLKNKYFIYKLVNFFLYKLIIIHFEENYKKLKRN